MNNNNNNIPFLCLIKLRALKEYLNWRHDTVHSFPWHQMEVSNKLCSTALHYCSNNTQSEYVGCHTLQSMFARCLQFNILVHAAQSLRLLCTKERVTNCSAIASSILHAYILRLYERRKQRKRSKNSDKKYDKEQVIAIILTDPKF